MKLTRLISTILLVFLAVLCTGCKKENTASKLESDKVIGGFTAGTGGDIDVSGDVHIIINGNGNGIEVSYPDKDDEIDVTVPEDGASVPDDEVSVPDEESDVPVGEIPELDIEYAQHLVDVTNDDASYQLYSVFYQSGWELVDRQEYDGGVMTVETYLLPGADSMEDVHTGLAEYMTDKYIASNLTDSDGNIYGVRVEDSQVYIDITFEARGYPLIIVSEIEKLSEGVYYAHCMDEFSMPGDPTFEIKIVYDNGKYKVDIK